MKRLSKDRVSECARLYAAVFNRAPWNGNWTLRTAAKHIAESLADPNFCGVVAEAEGELFGFAYGVISQWENERRFYLKEMCVRASEQRGGVGSRLLIELFRRIKAKKVSEVALGTEKDKPARRFYLRHGFKVHPRVVIMTKRL